MHHLPSFASLGGLPPCNTITPCLHYSMNISFPQLISQTSLINFVTLYSQITFWKLCNTSSFLGTTSGYYTGTTWVLRTRFIYFRKSLKTPEPAQFQAISPFAVVGAQNTHLSHQPPIFKQKCANIVYKNATIYKNCSVFICLWTLFL